MLIPRSGGASGETPRARRVADWCAERKPNLPRAQFPHGVPTVSLDSWGPFQKLPRNRFAQEALGETAVGSCCLVGCSAQAAWGPFTRAWLGCGLGDRASLLQTQVQTQLQTQRE